MRRRWLGNEMEVKRKFFADEVIHSGQRRVIIVHYEHIGISKTEKILFWGKEGEKIRKPQGVGWRK